jgi:uncharacterized protein (DUF111 family)
MTTFTMQDLNNIPVTKEEDEAMDALSRLGAGVPLWKDPSPLPELPTPTLETIITNICAQLQLLSSVIKEGQGAGTDVPSLQECVSTTLQQAEWFKEAVEEKVETLVDDMDHSYEIESAVETYFSNSFSLDDHVDITAEVESKVEDIAEEMLKDIVEERLAEIVSNKLQNLRITFD